ncbi:MAG: hypothetical protein PHR43_02900 [Dehalococcoidales bacterium]|nr:hypothetical protein [Dehalococcoidales bacterium]
MKFKKAVVRSFSSGSYTATVQLIGSLKVYLEDIAVARNIPSAEMITGRKAVVVFFDEHNPAEVVVTAVYT